MSIRQDIVKAARKQLGVAYHHQGRMPGVGLDCIGLLVCVAKEVGLPIHDYTNYGRVADGITLPRELSRNMRKRIKGEPVCYGDALTFWIAKRGKPNHLAFCTDVGMLHTYAASSNSGFVMEHALGGVWTKRFMSVYTFPDLPPPNEDEICFYF